MAEKATPGDIKDHAPPFKTIAMVWCALLAGLLLFFIIALAIGAPFTSSPGLEDPRLLAGLLVCASGCIGSFMLPGRLKNRINPNLSVPGRYFNLCMIRWTLIEGPGLFSGILILLTRSWFAVGLFAVSVVVLLYSKPSRQQMEDWFRDF